MSPGPWHASIQVRRPTAESAERLYRSLAPEAEREVPRARCSLRRVPPRGVSLTVTAQETGALRAALNTYLGWIDLSEATERVGTPRPPTGPALPEALK